MKNGKKIIAPTGYMGSGSSAVTDLMSEIQDVDCSKGSFEFVFLHCPNGVFDLEDKLLIGNNALRSDEALHSFAHTMKQLYDKKYWWVGHYNKNVGEKFWEITQKYIEELTEFRPEFYWYYQENVNYKMIPGLVRNKLIKLLSGGKKTGKKPLLYPEMWISYVSNEEFYKLTKSYIYQVINMAGYDKGSIVLDQLLLPFNVQRVEHYFDDDLQVFIVERDPRDVFIINKYFWSKQNEPVAYPTDVYEFCKCYKKLRNMEKDTDSPQVCRIKFEDLVYDYDNTVDKIFGIMNWDKARHVHKKEKFNPDRSINNTQLFLSNPLYQKECDIIAQELKEYLYEFPYEISHDKKAVF